MSNNSIYRDFTLPRLGKDACTKFLQSIAISRCCITSCCAMSNGFSAADVRYQEIHFRLKFLCEEDLDKFHAQGFATTEPPRVAIGVFHDRE